MTKKWATMNLNRDWRKTASRICLLLLTLICSNGNSSTASSHEFEIIEYTGDVEYTIEFNSAENIPALGFPDGIASLSIRNRDTGNLLWKISCPGSCDCLRFVSPRSDMHLLPYCPECATEYITNSNYVDYVKIDTSCGETVDFTEYFSSGSETCEAMIEAVFEKSDGQSGTLVYHCEYIPGEDGFGCG